MNRRSPRESNGQNKRHLALAVDENGQEITCPICGGDNFWFESTDNSPSTVNLLDFEVLEATKFEWRFDQSSEDPDWRPSNESIVTPTVGIVWHDPRLRLRVRDGESPTCHACETDDELLTGTLAAPGLARVRHAYSAGGMSRTAFIKALMDELRTVLDYINEQDGDARVELEDQAACLAARLEMLQVDLEW